MLPQDPMMLLSVINMKLRDQYESLEALCDDMDVSIDEITVTLANVGYTYDQNNNQFKQEKAITSKRSYSFFGSMLW